MTHYNLAKMLPQWLPASLDWRVLRFAVGLTAVVGLLIGLIPVDTGLEPANVVTARIALTRKHRASDEAA